MILYLVGQAIITSTFCKTAIFLFHTFVNYSSKLSNKGICFREITQCNKHEDCKHSSTTTLIRQNNQTSYCCRNHCCPQEYYHAWREWQCHSHISCQQLGTGSHCCNEHNEIISNLLNIKDEPIERTKCCFQDKVRQIKG